MKTRLNHEAKALELAGRGLLFVLISQLLFLTGCSQPKRSESSKAADTRATLKFVSRIEIPAFRYFAADRSFPRGSHRPDMTIEWLGDNFSKHLLHKVEEAFPSHKLELFSLRSEASTKSVIDSMDAPFEIPLHDLWSLLVEQSDGRFGALQTDGHSNLGFVRDANGSLWAVDAFWSGTGWKIGASDAEGRHVWNAGTIVITSKPEAASPPAMSQKSRTPRSNTGSRRD